MVLEPSSDGGYAVQIPALPGCHAQGENVEEALSNAKEAIRVYLRTLRHETAKKVRRGRRASRTAAA